jgi:hypothetical protein
MKILFILNDAPYGSEKSYNALRLAITLLKERPDTEVRLFLSATGSRAGALPTSTPSSSRVPCRPTSPTKDWQAARTDGELLWVLKHGSPGTAMAPFVPSVLTEKEAWQIVYYLRSLAGP